MRAAALASIYWKSYACHVIEPFKQEASTKHHFKFYFSFCCTCSKKLPISTVIRYIQIYFRVSCKALGATYFSNVQNWARLNKGLDQSHNSPWILYEFVFSAFTARPSAHLWEDKKRTTKTILSSIFCCGSKHFSLALELIYFYTIHLCYPWFCPLWRHMVYCPAIELP